MHMILGKIRERKILGRNRWETPVEQIKRSSLKHDKKL